MTAPVRALRWPRTPGGARCGARWPFRGPALDAPPSRRTRLAELLLALAATAAPGCGEQAPELEAEPWPEANALFLDDPRWAGGDGAYSVDLGSERVLWLFGDSFIATTEEHSPRASRMIRNSVAIQTGYDPSRAFLQFYWRRVKGNPESFVPEDGPYWYWPGHGIRVGDRLLLFYGRLVQERPGNWGYEDEGWGAFLVSNPDDEPSDWVLEPVERDPTHGDVRLGDAVIRDGEWLYVWGREGRFHDAYLARFPLERAMSGDLRGPEFWDGRRFGPPPARRALVETGAPEFSVHHATPLGRWLYVQTEGFGATTLALRSARSLTGPWSEPRDLLRPPESFVPDAFVYAGKAHPHLRGADLVATYVPSSFHDGLPPAIGDTLYHPRFVKIRYR